MAPRTAWFPVRLGTETPLLERGTKSKAVAYSRVTACDRLRFHSATAKQYCSSSSAVARHATSWQRGMLLVFPPARGASSRSFPEMVRYQRKRWNRLTIYFFRNTYSAE